MSSPEKVADFVRRLQHSRPAQEDRARLMAELRSPEAGLGKEEMIAIARDLVGRGYRSKKAALEAIDAWFWHRVRAAEDAAAITRAGAR